MSSFDVLPLRFQMHTISSVHATCPDHRIIVDFMNWIIFDESADHEAPHNAVSSSLLSFPSSQTPRTATPQNVPTRYCSNPLHIPFKNNNPDTPQMSSNCLFDLPFEKCKVNWTLASAQCTFRSTPFPNTHTRGTNTTMPAICRQLWHTCPSTALHHMRLWRSTLDVYFRHLAVPGRHNRLNPITTIIQVTDIRCIGIFIVHFLGSPFHVSVSLSASNSSLLCAGSPCLQLTTAYQYVDAKSVCGKIDLGIDGKIILGCIQRIAEWMYRLNSYSLECETVVLFEHGNELK